MARRPNRDRRRGGPGGAGRRGNAGGAGHRGGAGGAGRRGDSEGGRQTVAPGRKPRTEGWSAAEAALISAKRNRWVCVYSQCKGSWASKQQFLAHYKARHANKWLPKRCNICFNRFKNIRVFKRHCEEGHIGIAPTGVAEKLYGDLLRRMALGVNQLYWLKRAKPLVDTPPSSPSASETSSSLDSETSSSSDF